jgi:hypothetical protein
VQFGNFINRTKIGALSRKRKERDAGDARAFYAARFGALNAKCHGYAFRLSAGMTAPHCAHAP